MNEIVKAIAEVIEEVTDIPAASLNGDTLLIDDLNLSSLQIMILFAELGRKYSIEVSAEELMTVKSISDLATIIQND